MCCLLPHTWNQLNSSYLFRFSISTCFNNDYMIRPPLERSRGLDGIRNLLQECPKLQIMQALILSVFWYFYPVSSNSLSKACTDRILTIQDFAKLLVFYLSPFNHKFAHRAAANLLPMEAVCRMLTRCITFRYV